MELIYLLTDYKGHFGSKHDSTPYRSGLDKAKLSRHFAAQGFETRYLGFSDVDFRDGQFQGRWVLYTSAEDGDLHYKSFIEDVVLGLEIAGARVLPGYRYLRAHHDKVFMSILLELSSSGRTWAPQTRRFGTREELEERIDHVSLPSVIKPAAGSMSAGVRRCETPDELRVAASQVSASPRLSRDLWDMGRRLRRRGYVRESRHRRKFVAQQLIPALQNDWKVLVYGRKYYPLLRRVRPADFRASGSGRFEFKPNMPPGLLHFAAEAFDELEVPHLSLDIAHDGARFHLLEFQAVYFGTLTIERAPFHFELGAQGWNRVEGRSEVEAEYVQGAVEYIWKHQLPS